MALPTTARVESHWQASSSTTTTITCTKSLQLFPQCALPSVRKPSFRHAQVSRSGLREASSVRCVGRGPGMPGGPSLGNKDVKRPSLDAPTPYKPIWTPGGFAPAGPAADDSTASGDTPKAYVPMSDQEWAEKAAMESAKRKELLEQLQNQLGTWHERVHAMRTLQKAGELSAEEVADEARLVGLDSTRLMVAGSVHDSLLDLDPELLQHFDGPDGPTVLYELRTLSVAQRGPVVEYIVEHGLGADEARELVKAVKDHERRPEGREGFTEAPGDALAFWYFRNAGETREAEKKARMLEKALEVAESETAKERVSEVFDDLESS